jgi:hypothetical protein
MSQTVHSIFRSTVRPWIVCAKTFMPQRSIFVPRSRSHSAAAVVTIGLAAAAVMGTGTAYAYMKATGSGSGASTATVSSRGFDLTTTATTTTTLLHPNSDGDVKVVINNPGGFAATVTQVQFGTASATGCTTPAITYPTNPTTASLPVTVPAQVSGTPGSVTVTFTNAIHMAASSSDCQGKTLTIPVTLSWKS